MVARSLAAIALAWPLACGSPTAAPPPPDAGGAGGESSAGGGHATGCPAGTIEDGSTCLAPGVPEEGCAAGFVHDGQYGCTAVIPESDCGPGEMVVLGETTCQVVAPCPTGVYPEIPPGPAVFVDAAAAPGGDGSLGAPVSSIQLAVELASDGATIAIAAGDYAESVEVVGKTVHLVGRCPGSLSGDGVVITGDGVNAAVGFALGADGSSLSGVTLAGSGTGLSVSGSSVSAQGLVVDQVGQQGVLVSDGASLDLERLRIDLVHAGGATQAVVVQSSALTARRIDVEATIAQATEGDYQAIVALHESTVTLESARLHLAGIVNDHGIGGLYARHGSVDVVGSYIHGDLAPQLNPGSATLPYMPCVRVHRVDEGSGDLALALRQSVIRGGFPATITITRGDVSLDRTVVRDGPEVLLARGIECGPTSLDPSPPAARVTIERSLFDALSWAGIDAAGCEITLEGTVVRGTKAQIIPAGLSTFFPEFDEAYAGVRAAVAALVRPSRGIEGRLVVRDSLFVDNDAIAIGTYSSHVVVEHSRIEATRATESLEGELTFGDGIALAVANLLNEVPASPQAIVTSSHLHGNERAGVASFGGQVELIDDDITCSPIGLHGQVMTVGEVDFPYAYDDGGGNRCGCDEAKVCQVASDGLMPPPPLLDQPD